MVCILKMPDDTSPGLMTFTHNEYLFGGLKTTQMRSILSNRPNWRFGVHIQGNCSFLKEWPDSKFIDFIMWPNPHEHFLKNVKHKIIPKTCVFFYPKPFLFNLKKFDICITSRASEHKNFDYSLELVKKILIQRPETSIIFLTPDNRKHKIINIKKNKNIYFSHIHSYFSREQLNQISFISPSQESFGLFPITSDLYWSIINLSKTILLTSLVEGTPRCIIEAIIHQTMPCIMNDLKSGLNLPLSNYNLIRLDQINDAQKIINYLDGEEHQYTIQERSEFLFDKNWPDFINLINKITSSNLFNEKASSWLNHNLTNRLAGHLQKGDIQLMNESEMKKCLDKIFLNQINLNDFS